MAGPPGPGAQGAPEDPADPAAAAADAPAAHGTAADDSSAAISHLEDESTEQFRRTHEQCSAFPRDRSSYVNFELLLRRVKAGDFSKMAVLATLHEELSKSASFATEKLKALEADVEVVVNLVSAKRERPNAGGMLHSLQNKLQEKRTRGAQRRELEGVYLRAVELLQFAQVNKAAVARIKVKIQNKYSGGSASPGEDHQLTEEETNMFADGRNLLKHVLDKTRDVQERLESTCSSVEDVESLRRLAAGQSSLVAGRLGALVNPAVTSLEVNWKVVCAVALVVLLCLYARFSIRVTGVDDPSSLRSIAQLRLLAMILGVWLLIVLDAMPLFCVVASMPPLALAFGVFILPEQTMKDQVSALITSCFDEVMHLFLAMQLLQVLCDKCHVGTRAWNLAISSGLHPSSNGFLLLIILFTCGLGSVLPSGVYMTHSVMPKVRNLTANGVLDPKRLLLGIMFAANFGSALFPFSNLIAFSVMHKFRLSIPLWSWACVCIPCALLSCLVLWAVLVAHPWLPRIKTPDAFERAPLLYSVPQASLREIVLILLFLLLVVHWALVPLTGGYFGDFGLASLVFIVIVVGSGSVSPLEFDHLSWDRLLLIAGANAICFLLRHTGLLQVMAGFLLTDQEVLTHGLWWNSVKLAAILSASACLFGDFMTMLFLLPFVCILGVHLYAAPSVMLVSLLAISISVAFAFSTSQNHAVSREARDDFFRRLVSDKDVAKVGVVITPIGFLIVCTVGFWIARGLFGRPLAHIRTNVHRDLTPAFRHHDQQDALEVKLDHLERRFRDLNTGSGQRKLGLFQRCLDAHLRGAPRRRAEAVGRGLAPGHLRKSSLRPAEARVDYLLADRLCRERLGPRDGS